MLDPVIHKHLDIVDKIKNLVDDDIDKLVDNIDIDSLIKNPEAELLMVVMFLKKRLMEEHIPEVVKAGVEFSKNIKKDGDIMVQKSKDVNLNEGILK